MKKKAFIPISALVGALLLAIIATMTPFIAERNLAYAQTNSDIATLSRLTVSTGTLSPAFDPADLSVPDGGTSTNPHAYTVNVPNSVSSLTVSATKTDRSATVAYIVNGGTPGNSGRMSLAIGASNVVVVEVTAEDATTQKFYQVTVTRASSTASNDATLSILTVAPGMTTSPDTLGTKFEYSVDLPYVLPDNNVNLTATATEAGNGAVVTVKKGNEVIAVADRDTIAIDEGDNTITVDVLAPDFRSTKTYKLTINRARRNASDDDTLSSLSLSQGMLMPAFDPADLPGDAVGPHEFAVSVPHSVIEVTVMAATTDSGAKWEVTAPAEDNDSTQRGHQVSLTAANADGDTVITIGVTAEDRGDPRVYQVTVTRAAVGASTDATLSILTVAPGMTTSPDTLGTKFEYSVELPYTLPDNNVNLTATATEAANDAVVTVKKGNKVIAVADRDTIAIDEGDNTITVDVLAPDFVSTKTYTLTINRASANASDDDRLSSLRLSEGMFMPAFDPADLPGDAVGPHLYTDRVANSVESLTVRAQAAHSGAMVNIMSAQDSSVSDGAVDLIVGDNVITIGVTAEDRGDPRVYQVTVTRASSTASNDATLSILTVAPGMTTSPDTLGTKFEYSVDLPYVLPDNNVNLTATATEAGNGAVVTVKKGNEVIAVAGRDTIAIDEGDNTITVDVLAPDFVSTKTYTLTINRASANASDDDTLSSLSLSQGMLMPAFDPADLPGEAAGPHEYTARVANSVGSLTVMAGAAQGGAMVNIMSAQDSSVSDGAVDLIVGDNVITIGVTAEDRGDPRVYQVTVTRVAASASSNAALSQLTLHLGTDVTVLRSLNPAFDTTNLPALVDGAHHFTASVPRGTGMVRVTPVVAPDSGADANVMSDADVTMVENSTPPAYLVDLEVGDNVITVMVLAENVVTTKTYKITINRPGISNAALSDLSLSGVSLNEAFGTAADDAYTADAASSVESTTVMATAVQGNAIVSIMPVDADSAMDGHQVALTTGSNMIIVTVTAGGNTRVYTVTVTVAPPVEGDLLDRYDADDSGDIDLTEVSAAIDDYFNDDLTLDEVSAVIDLYFG